MNSLQHQLRQLYGDRSKHANYQNVPSFVRDALGYQESIDESWRGDTARYAYLLHELALQPGQTVADVGANTGFFVLSLAHSYPECRFVAYESHPNHVDFIRLVAEAFDLSNVVVENRAVDLAAIDDLSPVDVLIHLNVLHHAGHDFDTGLVSGPQEMDRYAQAYLHKLAGKARLLALQTGYNWGGNKSQPIVDPHDQAAMVAWLGRQLQPSGWQVERLAFATRDGNGEIVYHSLPAGLLESKPWPSQHNAALQQAIQAYHLEQFKGEFYRRPLVICRSHQKADVQRREKEA